MRAAAIALLLVAGLVAGPAVADPSEPGAEPKLKPANGGRPAPAGLSHKGQLEVSLQLALGLRAIAPYHDEYCGKTDDSGFAPVCVGRAPFAIDLELGYGVGHRIDTFLDLRLALEQDFGPSPTSTEGARLFHLSPGARFFFSDARKTKLFTTGQLVFDFSGYKDPAGSKLGGDFGVRNQNGLWFDLDRAYGIYAFIGETLTFARWLRFELEAGIGFQGRYR